MAFSDLPHSPGRAQDRAPPASQTHRHPAHGRTDSQEPPRGAPIPTAPPWSSEQSLAGGLDVLPRPQGSPRAGERKGGSQASQHSQGSNVAPNLCPSFTAGKAEAQRSWVSAPSLLLQSLDSSPHRDGECPVWGCHQGENHPLPFPIPGQAWLYLRGHWQGGRQSQPWKNATGGQRVKCCLENSGKICLCHGSEQLLWLPLQDKQWVFKNPPLHTENGNQ